MGLIRIISENRVKIGISVVLLILLFTSTILMNIILGAFIPDELIRLRLQKLVFLYSILNSLFFGLLGYLVLHHIIIRPINQLTLKTEKIKEINQIPFMLEGTKSSSEIGRLTSSFLRMIKRIEDDKKELKKRYEELKQAQSDLIRSEKLASIGRLSSGIAHEIGNPLGIILGYIDLLKRSDISEKEKEDYLSRAEKELERIRNIIQQLLNYARQREEKDISSVSIHNTLKDTVDMLKPQKGMKEIIIKWSLKAENDYVMGSQERLKQLFLNIILNAMDALNEEGSSGQTNKEIFIGTKNETINGKAILVTEIRDNGTGIPAQNIQYIFEPFFTTKGPGKGTGLGLSVCRNIVDNMGGKIEVDSKPGMGTIIKILLPTRK